MYIGQAPSASQGDSLLPGNATHLISFPLASTLSLKYNMPSHTTSLHVPYSLPTDENAHASHTSSKPPAVALPKRALGDITNLSSQPSTGGGPFKIPRDASTKVIKPLPSSSVPVRLARRPRTGAPLTPRRRSLRLVRQATEAARTAGSHAYPTAPGSLDGLFTTVCLPEGLLDIDAPDSRDELSNATYAKDVYENLFQSEAKFMVDARYMLRQRELSVKMRAILVDWLVDVHQRFDLCGETLHLAVHVADRFLSAVSVSRRRLQLVGVTALFIAAKYEDIYMPPVKDFVAITDCSYDVLEIYEMEASILNELGFRVTVPSTLPFLRRCIKAARAESGCETEKLSYTAQYIVELGLQDFAMLRFRPSLRAAASVRLAAKLCYVPIGWSRSMEFYSGGWGTGELDECERELRRILNHERDVDGANRLTAVKRKFSVVKFGCVSNTLSDELR